MGRIVAEIGGAYVASVGPAYDDGKVQDPAGPPLFDAYALVETRLGDEVKPDVAIVIFDDHGSDFDLRHAPTFAIGVGDAYDQADEGHGMRPPVRDDADLRWPMAWHLINAGFDVTMCQDIRADHNLLVPLLFEHDPN